MKTHRRRALFQLEAFAALCVALIVLGGFFAGIFGLAKTSHALISRQQATLAAEAVINELREGQTPSDATLADRFPNMRIQIEREAGEGDFAGFERATVTVDAYTHERQTAHVALSCHLPREEER